MLTLITSPALTSYILDPLLFFFDPFLLPAQREKSLRIRARSPWAVVEGKIREFVRTPEGRGVGVVRDDGAGDVWAVRGRGMELGKVRGKEWGEGKGDHVVVLDGGKSVATYSSTNLTLTLHSHPAITLSLPSLTSLFSLPSSGTHESIIGITSTFSIIHIIYTPSPSSSEPESISQHSHQALPSSAKMILPVDPMAWSGEREWSEHDVLLSVSEDGELAFWILDEGAEAGGVSPWRCTEKVRTGRKGFSRARCSSAKKSALGVYASRF